MLEGGSGQLITHVSKGRITVVLEGSHTPHHCGEQADELLPEYHTFPCGLDIHLPCDSRVALQHS